LCFFYNRGGLRLAKRRRRFPRQVHGQTALPCPWPSGSATRNPYRNPQSVSEIRNPYQKSVSYFFLQGGYRAFFMAGFIRNP
jgi:hypothetical protein